MEMRNLSIFDDGKFLGFRARGGGGRGKESLTCWCQRVSGEENEETDVSEVDFSQDVASGVGSSAPVSGCKNFSISLLPIKFALSLHVHRVFRAPRISVVTSG